MPFEISTYAYFNAAHFLTNFGGKCENLHGHRWRVEAYLRSPALPQEGEGKDMVMDFGAFKKIVRSEVKRFDHTFIVEAGSLAPKTIAALEEEGFHLTVVDFRTTAENFARYFCTRFTEQGLTISEVRVFETPHNCAIYKK